MVNGCIISSFSEKLKNDIGDTYGALILYGSYVTGSNDEYSDLDLCVMVKNKTSEVLQTVGKASAALHDVKYFITIIQEDELWENLCAGDLFCKHEVLGKGKILYENNGILSRWMLELETRETDFKASLEIHRHRYHVNKEGLRLHLESTLEKLEWAFTSLILSRFTETETEPESIKDAINLMKKDSVLSKYFHDFIEIRETTKNLQHHRIEFPFKKLEHYINRLEKIHADLNG